MVIFSTWLGNRNKLVGEGRPAAGNVYFDYHADGTSWTPGRFGTTSKTVTPTPSTTK